VFFVFDYRRQAGARQMQFARNHLSCGRLAYHLREDFEVGDPQRTVSFKRGDSLCPSGFESLCGRDVGRNSSPQCPLKILVPSAKASTVRSLYVVLQKYDKV
jgi:hypothetical protein